MKYLGRKKLKIADLESYFFNRRIIDVPYVNMAKQELVKKPYKGASLYYMYLKANKDQEGSVFGGVRIGKRYKEWKELFGSVEEWRNKNTKYELQDGLPYGPITGISDGNVIKIVDGHHRLAILCAMGYEDVKVSVFEE